MKNPAYKNWKIHGPGKQKIKNSDTVEILFILDEIFCIKEKEKSLIKVVINPKFSQYYLSIPEK